MKRLQLIFAFLCGLSATACLSGVMDALGREESVTETRKNASVADDDRIEDKNPKYDPDRTVFEVFHDRCVVRLNKTGSVAKLDIEKPSDEDEALMSTVFSSRSAAAEALGKRLDRDRSLIPSIEVVNGAMKPFNDGLYAAVEEGVELGMTDESGGEIYPSKLRFLHDLLAAVLAAKETASAGASYFDAAAADVGAALLLGGENPSLPDSLMPEAEELASKFGEAPLYSRPIGFYTWTETLGRVFRQDRFLQNYQGEEHPYADGEVGKAAAMALAIDSDESLTERYDGYLALYAGLTNPFMNHPVTALLPYLGGAASLGNTAALTDAFLLDYPPPDLLPECQPRFALFPSSKSKETVFFESMFCTGEAPSGINYMDELIYAIKDGRVDLTPEADSGWYDYQSHALEVLLLPERGAESDHLLLTAAYKRKLIESFKSILTQNRETHVKQLEMGSTKGSAGPMLVDLYPNFPAEPFPTFYLRSARAYRFLGAYLEAVLGREFLDGSRRMTEDGGAVSKALADELADKARLLYGLHFLTADAVGVAPEMLEEEMLEYSEDECRALARAWVKNWLSDEDVNRDSRVIVPVQREGENVVYWATLGTRIIKAKAEFVEGYEPKVLDMTYDDIPDHIIDADLSGDGMELCEVEDIVPHDYYLLVDTFAEVRLPEDAPPPTRDEYRAILDEHDKAEDMVRALESL